MFLDCRLSCLCMVFRFRTWCKYAVSKSSGRRSTQCKVWVTGVSKREMGEEVAKRESSVQTRLRGMGWKRSLGGMSDGEFR